MRELVGRQILCTRSSHLATTSEEFARSLGAPSRRKRPVRVIELLAWTRETVVGHIHDTARCFNGVPKERLTELAKAVAEHEAERLYGSLLSHPIFLDLIIDEVSEEGMRASTRADLVRSWILRKVKRDQAKYDGAPIGGDAVAEIELIWSVLEGVAMVLADDQYAPKERLPYAEFAKLSAGAGVEGSQAIEVLLKSVLVTVGLRTSDADCAVMFSHRIFHEYMIAAAMVRLGLEIRSRTPREVSYFYSAIKNGSEPAEQESVLGATPDWVSKS